MIFSTDLVAPSLETGQLQRTSSEPDLSEFGKRTASNASACSRNKVRMSHCHLTEGDLNLRSRTSTRGSSQGSRAASFRAFPEKGEDKQSSLLQQGPCQSSNDISSVQSESESSAGSDVHANGAAGNPISRSEITVQAFEKLRRELDRAQLELRRRDDQCKALARVRDEVDVEVEELTASLFQEAHKMVNEANVLRASAEKRLYEVQLKCDGLQAEVAALKLLVITSTPANPGRKRHQRAASNGQICSECESVHVLSDRQYAGVTSEDEDGFEVVETIGRDEVDPIVFRHFLSWIEDKCPLQEHQFLNIVHKDDIVPCLRFSDEELAKSIHKALQNNTLLVEAVTAKKKPKKCCLTKLIVPCTYRVRASDAEEWYPISSSSRARIVAVADFLTFLRYIRQGILKKDVNVLYWEMIKRRAEMSLARLGLRRDGGKGCK